MKLSLLQKLNIRQELNMSSRFYILDFLRGLAALFVVIWHYRHFYYQNGVIPDDFDVSNSPLFVFLKIPYTHGGLAVEFFFCLSGFIFFQYYYKKIKCREINFKEFFIRRLLRLYPVFLCSLILTSILLRYFHNSSFNIYEFNDLKHFFYNLLLIHQWGIQDGWSFNGPSWSISVEWFLYILFFMVCLIRINILIISTILITLGFIIFPVNPNIGRGVILFFFSSFIWIILNNKKIPSYIKLLLVLLYLFITSMIVNFIPFMVQNFYPSLNIFLDDKSLFELFFIMGLVPVTVFLGAFININNNFLNKICDYFGQLSYPIYLFHFPVQLILVNSGIMGNPNSVTSLLVYLSFVFVISHYFNKFFDKPIRMLLTKKLLSK